MEREFTAIQKFINTVIEFCVEYSFSVLGAIIILILGFFIGSQLAALVARLLQKKNVDVTLTKFTASFVKMTVITFAIIISLGNFGITITPFIAAIGGAAVGIGFAFQGPLANYGAGLSIILSRPFIVGDTITVQDQSGVVQEVKLATTVLTTEDRVRITIPNKHIVGEILHNSKDNRIVDGVVGISYSDDAEKAIQAVKSTLLSIPEISKEPQPQIGIKAFGDSSVNIGMRYWVPTARYYQTLYQANLAVFKALATQGITIPFPQRDVHMISQAKNSVQV